jgi:hypothetical protein
MILREGTPQYQVSANETGSLPWFQTAHSIQSQSLARVCCPDSIPWCLNHAVLRFDSLSMGKSTAEARRRWAGDPNSTIRVLVSENPEKPNSKAWERFGLYRAGMTVHDYVRACSNARRPDDALIDITWDLAHGFIEVHQP